REKIERMEAGMTRAEIAKIFGSPGQDAPPPSDTEYGYQGYVFLLNEPGRETTQQAWWTCRALWIAVYFYDDGRAADKCFFLPNEPTLWERVRRRIGGNAATPGGGR